MIDTLKPLIKQFLPFAQERMGFEHPPRLFVRQDSNNAANPLGKTAYYDPEASSVTLYITDRHPKDVMRSLSHELVHHTQHGNGEFENTGEMGEGCAQNNPHMREMERQAYEVGNLCFRDWEDSIKGTIYSEHLYKGDKDSMSTKNWKNGEINTLLTEKWGFKFNLNGLNENIEPEEGVEEEEELEEEKKPDADGDGVPDWADKDSDSDKKELEEMCPMDHDHGEEDVMVVGDEGDVGEDSAEGLANELLSVAQRIADMLGQESSVTSLPGDDEEEPVEEGGLANRKGDPRQRRPDASPIREKKAKLDETQVRQLVRTALKRVMERKQ